MSKYEEVKRYIHNCVRCGRLNIYKRTTVKMMDYVYTCFECGKENTITGSDWK